MSKLSDYDVTENNNNNKNSEEEVSECFNQYRHH